MNRSAWVSLGFAVVAGVVAIGLASTWAEPAVVGAEEDEPPDSPMLAARPVDLTPDLMQAQAENLRLRQRLKELQAQREAARLAEPVTDEPEAPASTPEPIPFSPDVPAQYQPERFEEITMNAARSCGMGLDVIAVDCSEFPCIAWTRATDPSVKTYSMTGCQPWKDAFSDGELVIGAGARPDAGDAERFIAWMPMPPHRANLPAVIARARIRAQDMRVALGLSL